MCCGVFFRKFLELFFIMSMLSLDNDDCGAMFITQGPSDNAPKFEEDDKDDLFLGVAKDDFGSPSVDLVNRHEVAHYSDISNDEMDFETEYSR